jgi:hypothetical protein
MSWGTCYSGNNNIHFNSPPLMSDGRLYKEEKLNDEKIINNFNITNSYDYRRLLQSNANMIIDKNQLNYSGNHKYENTNYVFGDYLAKDSPYGYSNSNLKNLYLSRTLMDNQLNMPRFKITNISK